MENDKVLSQECFKNQGKSLTIQLWVTVNKNDLKR